MMRRAAGRLLARAVSRVYAIGVRTGDSLAGLAPPTGDDAAVLTGASVTDVVATTVADPFMIAVDGAWHMFFEVLAWRARGGALKKGEIGHAVSRDGLRWEYDRIVLAEPWHLSYPHVLQHGSDLYLVPESGQAGQVRLYRADPFPTRWVLEATLLEGAPFVDSSLFHRDGRWWMLTASSGEGSGTLRLFQAADLRGPWREHPRSPVVTGDPRSARPAGRVVEAGGRLLRFAQVCDPSYGTSVRCFEIRELTTDRYADAPVDDGPLLAGSGHGWNRSGMHHIDLHPRPGGGYLACVDGWASVNGPLRLLARGRDLVRGGVAGG